MLLMGPEEGRRWHRAGNARRRCRPRERELIQWKHHFEHLFNCVNHREQTLPPSPGA